MADNQDPLAALQKLLDDQKNQTGSADPTAVPPGQEGAENAPQEAPTGPTEQEINALLAEQAKKDQQKIEEQLLKMKTELLETPQYQARASQKETSEAEEAKKRLEERSQRIFQLKHLDPKE